ncbi:prephenate dehydrogenase [Chromatocurvus halotolerans]|nr:prephenate dehydrogenase/arogenate dehydrogenase family protein [Chromatocurvus halotolerans]
MPEKPAPTVAIIGLGLIGGSLALALREAGEAGELLGCDKQADAVAEGIARRVIDRALQSPREALAQADIIVLCVPTMAAADLLADLTQEAARTGSSAIITDVASVKGGLEARMLAQHGCVPPRVVLGHPIAGSERSGVGAARGGLFRDHLTILTPAENTDADALADVSHLWRAAGASVVCMAVSTHDRVLAATSHLPHVLAYCLVDTLARSPHGDDVFRFAAGGFRDFTRIASSDPVMWRDVALANRGALLEAIDDFAQHLITLRAAIDAGDGDALLQTFTAAKTARDSFSALQATRGRS